MEEIGVKIKRILLYELRLLKPYGVDQIGYRYFLPDGRSYGVPTCGGWYKANRDEIFYRVMKPFLSNELINLKKQSSAYISRSGENINSEYIECLRGMNMHNRS